MEEVPASTPIVPVATDPPPPVQPPVPTTVTPNVRNNTKIILLGIVLIVLVIVTVVVVLLIRSASKKVFIDTIVPLASQLPTPSSTPTSTQPDLPTPPTNFSWVECKNLKSWFLQPKGWYVFETNKSGTEACFISKESISQNGFYKTGLSVNLVTNITSKSGTKPSIYAKDFIQITETKYKTSPMNPVSVGNLQGYGREVESTFEGRELKQYSLALGNDVRDTMYIIIFETYRADWANDWATYGAPMLSQLGLYQ